MTRKIDMRDDETIEKPGLAKRLIEAAELLLLKNDAEAALLPLCTAIDRVAKELYGTGGRSVYQRFMHERMEMITRVAFNGLGILNMSFAIDPIYNERGRQVALNDMPLIDMRFARKEDMGAKNGD